MKSKINNVLLTLVSVFAFISAPASAQQIPRELTKILALGDSITEGYSSTSVGIESYRFPLTNTLDGTACNYTMVGRRTSNLPATNFVSKHEGYSGHGVEYFLNSIAENPGIDTIISDAQPDLVLIHLGSNDMNRSQGVANTIGELGQLASRIWNVKSDVIIYVANVIPWYGSSNNSNIQQNIVSLGAAIGTWVNNTNSDQLHFVDVKTNYLASYMQGDGVHPNNNGDSHIADAFLSAINSNNDCPTPPVTFISSPLNDGVTLPATHTFTGSALDTDGDGIQRVRIAIENNNYTNGSNRWWNFTTGAFGTYSESIATLANISSTSVTWSKSVTLPGGGDYQFYALAVDNLGNQNYYQSGVWPTNTRFYTSSDNAAPSTSIVSPANNAVVAPGSINFTGTATDTGSSGFNAVQFAVRDDGVNRWYDFSLNTFTVTSGLGAVSATLTASTNSFTNWNRALSLSAGNYTIAARAVDNAGNISAWSFRTFVVQAPDTLKPTTLITNPANNGAVITPGNINFNGTAADAGGSGFDSVQFAVRNDGNNRWYNFATNAFTGNNVIGAVAAPMTATTNNSTNWNRSVNLSAGTYTLAARAVDNAGNISTWSFRKFTVQVADNLKPTTLITSPATNGSVLAPGNINFSGTATDTGGSGFDSVQFAVRNDVTNRWYNFSTNTFTGNNVIGAVAAPMTATTNSSTNWNRSLPLAAGTYTLAARAVDNAGNISAWSFRKFTIQTADNLKPTTLITNPANNGAVIAPGNIGFNGTAADAGGSGFDSVQFAVRNDGTNRWYNFSTNTFTGNNVIGAVAAPMTATTNSSTNWNRSVNLAAGTYTLAARAVDNAGNISAWSFRKFTVQSPDTIDPSAATTNPATEGAVIANGNFTYSGTASDSGGSGIQSVQIAIRSRTLAQWYNFSNNSFSGAVGNGATTATLSNQSTTSANWNLSATLSPGKYTIAARAFDTAGNSSAWSFRKYRVQ